jgi:HEAT repeat protein
VRALLDRETVPEVRHAAIGALGRFGDVASAEALAGLALRGGREGRTASFALLELRDPEALEGAAARWPELDGDARVALLRAASGAEAPFARAAEALRDGDERVRREAVELLARRGDDAVEPLLDHALRAASTREAERALDALAGLATPKAAEAGLRALETLPPRRQAPYREAFLATLGR